MCQYQHNDQWMTNVSVLTEWPMNDKCVSTNIMTNEWQMCQYQQNDQWMTNVSVPTEWPMSATFLWLCGNPIHVAVTHIIVNSIINIMKHVATKHWCGPKHEAGNKQFSVTRFFPRHVLDFWPISSHFSDNCQIPGHFQVFQTNVTLYQVQTFEKESKRLTSESAILCEFWTKSQYIT